MPKEDSKKTKQITENDLDTGKNLVTENYQLEILSLKDLVDLRKFSRAFIKVDKLIKSIFIGKEDKFDKNDGFNLPKTNVPENNSGKLFTAKGALDLLNDVTGRISTAISDCKNILRKEILNIKTELLTLINGNTGKLEILERNKAPVLHTHDDRYFTEFEITEKLNKICPYRVGDILTTENKEHPALTWQGTTWTKIEAIFLRGTEAGQSAGVISGSNTVTLKIGNLPPHNHPISVILGNAGIHRHKVDNHIHTQPVHRHPEEVDGRGYSGSFGGIQQLSHAQAEGFSRMRPTTLAAGGENTGGASPYTDNQGNHNHSVTASSSNIGGGEAINIMPRYYTVHYWKRVS